MIHIGLQMSGVHKHILLVLILKVYVDKLYNKLAEVCSSSRKAI